MGFDFAVWASGLTLNRIFYTERECVLQLPCSSLLFLSVELGDPTACFNFPLYFSSCSVQAGRILTKTSRAPCKSH